jgi:DNA-binding beta-propeller fold protein YncE
LEGAFDRELVVIGVHSPKFPAEKISANVRAAIQRHGMTHPVVADPDFTVWQSYAVRAWPTLMFLDPAGRVFGKHEGEFPVPPVESLLREALTAYEAEGRINRDPLPQSPLPPGGAALRFPGKVLADGEGNRLFVADSGHHRIVIGDLEGKQVRVVGSGSSGLADGDPNIAEFNHPQGMALGSGGKTLYIADTGNHAIRAVDLNDHSVTTIAGTGYQATQRQGGPARETALSSPWDLAMVNGDLWLAMAGTHQVWALDLAERHVRPVAGTGAESIHDGPLADATFAQPSGLTALDGICYLADSESSTIRRIDPAQDRVRRIVGRGLFVFGDIDARGDSVRLQHPLGVEAVWEAGQPIVYVADTYNDKIKRLDPARREVTTVFGGDARGFADGSWRDAEFWQPCGLSIAGHRCFIADTNNHALRVADLATGEVHTLALDGLGPPIATGHHS